MVGQGFVTKRGEVGRDLLDVNAADCVDNARFVCVSVHYLAELLEQIASPPHAVDQVRPIERADEHLRLAQPQLADDVVADVGRRGGRVGVERHVRKTVFEHAQAAILRPEVVTPFADAVGLVDGQERQRHLLQKIERPIGEQPLGREIQQLQSLGFDFVGDLALLGSGERAVDASRADAAIHERVDLILHQRDQRRDHDRQPGHGERRRLEAETLAAAGGQHHERIAALDDGPHRLGLQRAEVVVAPDFSQDVAE